MDNDFCIFSFTKENYPRTLLLLVVVRMNKTYTLTFFFLWTALALIYHHEFLCAHQHSVDRESAINDYTIREKALKSNIFQFRNHKLSELVTNCNCLRRNGSPLDWGQEDSKSVSNRFQMASSVTHTFWQAAAYLTWYTLRGTSQVLIKRRAKWPAVELFWNSSQWGCRQCCPRETWYLWTKWLSRSICRHFHLSFCGFLSPCPSIWIPLGWRGETRSFPSHCSPRGHELVCELLDHMIETHLILLEVNIFPWHRKDSRREKWWEDKRWNFWWEREYIKRAICFSLLSHILVCG